jgi:DeoR/GlpR family transcriptional regulator of sugar metabolism
MTCAATEVDLLITDAGAPPDDVAALEEAGVEVETV